MTPDPTLIEQELLPCPFCSGEVRIIKATAEGACDWIEHTLGKHYVECGLMFSDFNLTGDLAAAWNTRALQSALPSETRPHGDAGDAIDFACGHIEDSSDAMDFLDNWRADFVLHQYPDYERWLATQRRCASEAKAMRATTPTAERCDQCGKLGGGHHPACILVACGAAPTAPVQDDDAELVRPIIGIANRTAQEVFDIMVDRFRSRLSPTPETGLIEAVAQAIATARSWQSSRLTVGDWDDRDESEREPFFELARAAITALSNVLPAQVESGE